MSRHARSLLEALADDEFGSTVVGPGNRKVGVSLVGRLGQPQVGIEATGLVGRVLGAVALGAVAGPVAALLPLIEQGSTNAVDPCTVAAAPAQAAAKPEAPVRKKP